MVRPTESPTVRGILEEEQLRVVLQLEYVGDVFRASLADLGMQCSFFDSFESENRGTDSSHDIHVQ